MKRLGTRSLVRLMPTTAKPKKPAAPSLRLEFFASASDEEIAATLRTVARFAHGQPVLVVLRDAS